MDDIIKAIRSYREIIASPKFQELERLRQKARLEEEAAIRDAEKRGKRKSMVNIALKMIKKGLSLDEIKEFVDLPDDELKKLIDDKS